jgi:acetolactate synthase I/II/III large subunit
VEDRITGSGAEAFIETLNDLEIDRIFLNPGIDLVPLMAVVARFKEVGKKTPRIITCTDESVAVAAAHGYAMVAERPQVAAVFEDIGLLQGGGAIVNLHYGQIPVVLFSGKNAALNRLNWKGDSFDQRKIVRDYVKWDYEVKPGEDISLVIREAMRAAGDEPCGPVYVDFSRDVLLSKRGGIRPSLSGAPAETKLPDQAEVIGQIAQILLQASDPLIMTAYSGRHNETVTPLVELAESLGARVVTTDRRMNFPSTHPLCPGIDCIRGDCYDHYIAEADVLLVIDYDFPGPGPKSIQPRNHATLIHLDIEPLKYGNPLWNRPADILVEGDSRHFLPALNEAVQHLLTADQKQRFEARAKLIAGNHRQLKDDWRRRALSEADSCPISPEWLSYCLNEALEGDTIIVQQIPSHADALSRHLRREDPGTMFTWGGKAGSMGWALPAAFGAKLAAPDKLVVSLIGDGGFIYGCPTATLWGATAYKAPFLTVIFNNSAYTSFRDVMAMFYGQDMKDAVRGELGFDAGIEITDPPDFAAIARACRAYGDTVTDPLQIPSALKRAIAEVRNGRSAVLDVKLSR